MQSQTQALTLSDSTLRQSQAQARRFDTNNEGAILTASAGVLQDLGFTIDNTAPGLGMLTGSKTRDAVETGQVAVALAAALVGVATPIETMQRIRVSIVTSPTPDRSGIVVQTVFQRVLWDSKGQITRRLPISDPALYRNFYDKLAQSVFLEAHNL